MAFEFPARKDYVGRMAKLSAHLPGFLLGMGALALGAVMLAAIAGYDAFGATILLTYAERGMSLCF